MVFSFILGSSNLFGVRERMGGFGVVLKFLKVNVESECRVIEKKLDEREYFLVFESFY